MPGAVSRQMWVLDLGKNPAPGGAAYPYRASLGEQAFLFALDKSGLDELYRHAQAEIAPQQYGEALYSQVFDESCLPPTAVSPATTPASPPPPATLGEWVAVNLDAAGIQALQLRTQPGSGLEEIAWEFARQPIPGGVGIGTDLRIALSRVSEGPIPNPTNERLHMLALVCCPPEDSLAGFNHDYQQQLAYFNPSTYTRSLRKHFATFASHIDCSMLKAPDRQTTLEALTAALAQPYHILYLVCHGVILNQSVYFVMQDEYGGWKLVPGKSLTELLDNHPALRLVILSTCHSAAQFASAGAGSLAPLLAGLIPAVIGMQREWYTGKIEADFIDGFFPELFRSGLVDQAVQSARALLLKTGLNGWGWGTPVLFTRRPAACLFTPQAPTATVSYADRLAALENQRTNTLQRTDEVACQASLPAADLRNLLAEMRSLCGQLRRIEGQVSALAGSTLGG